MYRQLYPYSKSDKFCARIFSIFDCDKDGCLNFNEFLRALKITMNGNVNDKLRCAFQIYDLNGDGHLDRKETKIILENIYDMVGEDRRKSRKLAGSADKKVDLIFQKFDLDRDGKLTLEEFIAGCLRDEYLSSLLKTTFFPSSSSSSSSSSYHTSDSNASMLTSGAVSSVTSAETSNSIDDTSIDSASNVTNDNVSNDYNDITPAHTPGSPADLRIVSRRQPFKHRRYSFRSYEELADNFRRRNDELYVDNYK